MANVIENACRLCLVTPPNIDLSDLLPHLSEAVAGGDVASVIITAASGEPEAGHQALLEGIQSVQSSGSAALLAHDIAAPPQARADGVHVASSADNVRAAIGAYRPDGIVGIGGLRSRHDAMAAGEFEPDYLFFGQLDGDTDPMMDQDALELALWWSSIAVVPAVVMGGSLVESVDQAATNGVDFVALGRAVWDHPDGPGAAVAQANRRLRDLEAAA